jgi:hypothetical protein
VRGGRRFWDDPAYPQRVWGAADWRSWRQAGSPPLPPGSRVQPKLDAVLPVVMPVHKVASIGGLYENRSDQRRRRADEILAAHGLTRK